MIGVPDCEKALVEESKLTYLLRPEDKGGFFLGLGFSPAATGTLREALASHACSARVAREVRTRYGVKFVLVGPMRSPDGRDPPVVSVWIFEVGAPGNTPRGSTPRFVTAYPADGEEER